MADYIVIDDDLRTMQIPESITLLGVESDDDVNRLSFQMPKEYSGFDLSTFQARINYMNANAEGDLYIVDDLAVDGDNLTFTWLVGRNACAYKGNVKFIVCLKKFDEDDVVVQEFNTTVYSLPVLEGLETTEAVVQQNPDIIEHILQMIKDAGSIDMSNYYTKPQVNDLIPSELPNPWALTINGTEYDGRQPVEMTIDADTVDTWNTNGRFIHISNAVAGEALISCIAFNDSQQQVSSFGVNVANKNLFRSDLLAQQVTSKGVTFARNEDGSITVSGTSTDSNAMTSCELDPNMFDTGTEYTLSSGKTSGYAYVQLNISYSGGSEVITARNASRTFTLRTRPVSVTASVQVAESGVTLNETIYPQLEIGTVATAYAQNMFAQYTRVSASNLPILPAALCNLWPTSANITLLQIEYLADTVEGKIDDYVKENVIQRSASALPEPPTADGTYTLTAKVQNGMVLYEWVKN